MSLFSVAQRQYAFDPRISLCVYSTLEQFYRLVCAVPPVVDLAQITGLSNGDQPFGASEWRVGKFLKKTNSGHAAVFVGFDFSLGKNPEYEDYFFGVSICSKDLNPNYQTEVRNGNFNVLERNDEWITVKLEETSLASPQTLRDAVSNIVKVFL
jgi:hypothetical protein